MQSSVLLAATIVCPGCERDFLRQNMPNVRFRVKTEVLASQSDVSFGSHSSHCSTRSARGKSASTTEPSNSEACKACRRNHPLILPDGQISWCFARAPVQPHLQKYFCSRLTRIKSISLTVLSHRGAFRDRHGRWERDAVDATASGAIVGRRAR